MHETSLYGRIRIALSKMGARLFRNNVGVLEDRRGKKVAFGLCVGSSDLIGWYPITVTPAMVGRRMALFVAIEVKSPSGEPPNPRQQNFLAAVRGAGGIAFVARSIEDAVRGITDANGGSEL